MAQLTLGGADGGLGLQTATFRRQAAFLGSWELCLQHVAAALAQASAEGFRAAAPALTAAIETAAADYRGLHPSMAAYRFEWEHLIGQSQPQRQGILMEDVHTAKLAELLTNLGDADKADVHSAGGAGSLGFLDTGYASGGVRMSDLQLRTAIRRRLRYPNPAFEPHAERNPTPATHCNKRYARSRQRPSGGLCGQALDSRGVHAVHCNVGGGVESGHDAIRDWLAKKLHTWTGSQTLTEQFVPQWDRRVPVKDRAGNAETDATGVVKTTVVRAKLDVQFYDTKGRLAYADVHIVSAQSVHAPTLQSFAAKPGRAAEDGEKLKRTKYKPAANPHAALVPFVIEALGRPGASAMNLLRAMAPKDATSRSSELRQTWCELSTLVQIRQADLLINAEYAQPGDV